MTWPVCFVNNVRNIPGIRVKAEADYVWHPAKEVYPKLQHSVGVWGSVAC
mgnify:CR=1 FL=1|jgi:hypothetical protein